MRRELPEIAKVVIARLKEVRMTLGLSQTEIGMRMGLPPDAALNRVNRYEHLVSSPSLQAVDHLAEALAVPVGFLVTREHRLATAIRLFALLSDQEQERVLAIIQEAAPALPAAAPPGTPIRRRPRRR